MLVKENAAHTVSHRRMDDMLLDHEERIKKIESGGAVVRRS